MITKLEGWGAAAELGVKKFVDLAPTADAKGREVEIEALNFAVSEPRILNIALTGPYGSGKSSIIQTFLRRYSGSPLTITLAAFTPGTVSDQDASGRNASRQSIRQQIESSILQQMLYGAYANRLPLSRFKRIRPPGIWSLFRAVVLTLGLSSSAYVFNRRDVIFEASASGVWNPMDVAAISVLILSVLVLVHHLIVASAGMTLRRVSLSDVELWPPGEGSVLNRHLDEIIYFFQTTGYDLVVFEDLDRFENTDVFVTLREINRLVNENIGVRPTVRFLYALRDDMFATTDRTKFFEFLIPVIPIINRSNSIDMVIRQGARLELDDRLDRRFLREVSHYITDFRLIRNIFNEFAIYVANVDKDESGVLGVDKLLAILIYKNHCPSDFEQLHRGEGNLAAVLNSRESMLEPRESAFTEQIQSLEARHAASKREELGNLDELRHVYVSKILRELPSGIVGIKVAEQFREPWSLVENDDYLEELLGQEQVVVRVPSGRVQRQPIEDIEGSVNPDLSFADRRASIMARTADRLAESSENLKNLRAQKAAVRFQTLSDLIRADMASGQDPFKVFSEEHQDLVRYLVLEGFLDDTYYNYISLFHGGRLSWKDHTFLIQIRSYTTPSPDFGLDNVSEIIELMRDEDFYQTFVLNVDVVDHLLGDESKYAKHLGGLERVISNAFAECADFFQSYYLSGSRIERLLLRLSDPKKSFLVDALSSSQCLLHVSMILRFLPETALGQCNEVLAPFLSDNLPATLAQTPDLSPTRLLLLEFDVDDLAAIAEYVPIVQALAAAGRYRMTPNNLRFVLSNILGVDELSAFTTSNYSLLRSTNDDVVLATIDKDFNQYLRTVLLTLETNTQENPEATAAIIGRDDVEHGALKSFLSRQETRLPTLARIGFERHALLFATNSIEATWANCLQFRESDGFDASVFVDFLEHEENRTKLSASPLSGDESFKHLRTWLFNADSLSTETYKLYVHQLPMPFRGFPQDGTESMLDSLIELKRVVFNQATFDSLDGQLDRQVRFLELNISTYLAEPEDFEVDDTVLEHLLVTGISDQQKARIVEQMNFSELPEDAQRASRVAPVVAKTDLTIDDDVVNIDVVLALLEGVKSSPNAQVRLMNKLQRFLDEAEVRKSLRSMSSPYKEIGAQSGQPWLDDNNVNGELVEWLENRELISSSKRTSTLLKGRGIRVFFFRSGN